MSASTATTIHGQFRNLSATHGRGLQFATVSEDDQPLKREEAERRRRVQFVYPSSGMDLTGFTDISEPASSGVNTFIDFRFVDPLFVRAIREFVVIDPTMEEEEQSVAPEREYDLFVQMQPLHIQKGFGKIVIRSEATPNPIFYVRKD